MSALPNRDVGREHLVARQHSVRGGGNGPGRRRDDAVHLLDLAVVGGAHCGRQEFLHRHGRSSSGGRLNEAEAVREAVRETSRIHGVGVRLGTPGSVGGQLGGCSDLGAIHEVYIGAGVGNLDCVTTMRGFNAGVGISSVSGTAVVTLSVQLSASDAAQLGGLESKFRAPASDMEAELADAATPSAVVVVDVSRNPAQLTMGGVDFLELPAANLPPGWASDARAQGRCLVMMGSGSHQRHVWASVKP